MYTKTLKVVLTKPFYIGLFLIVGFLVLSVAILLPHVGLLKTLLQHESVSLFEIGSLILSLYGSLGTNFTFISASYTVLIAFLFGLHITFLAYYMRSIKSKATGVTSVSASSLGGLVSGFFGIGCATCGTLLFSSALVLFGAGGLLAWLPFGGEEFGLIGVGLLIYANYMIIKKINAPLVCPT